MSRKVTLAGRFRKRLSPLFLSVIFTVTYYGRLFNGYFLPTCARPRGKRNKSVIPPYFFAFCTLIFVIIKCSFAGASSVQPMM